MCVVACAFASKIISTIMVTQPPKPYFKVKQSRTKPQDVVQARGSAREASVVTSPQILHTGLAHQVCVHLLA